MSQQSRAPGAPRLPGARGAKPASAGKRLDIQGLRAVAVVAVVVEHVSGWPRGGFVGVDVFFVISGFLITGLLLREHERTGRISMRRFYLRRVKRLMPSAAVVFVVTLGAVAALLSTTRLVSSAVDAGWSAVFLANWHEAARGVDYFAADGPVSPFRHFWSLSVEEQFYLVWPMLVLAAAVLAGRRLRGALGVVLAVVCAGSFLWAVVQSADAPVVAYYSTFTRTWELGAGALLAVTVGLWRSVPPALGTALGWIGTAVIVASVLMIDQSWGFPGPWAAVPVVATVAVIAGGSVPGARRPWPLTNPVAAYLGDISYSLYLWHWPALVVIRAVAPEATAAVYVAALSTAIVGHHLIEKPAMAASWDLRARLRRRDRPRTPGRHREQRIAAVGALAVVTMAVIALAADNVKPIAAPPVVTAGTGASVGGSAGDGSGGAGGDDGAGDGAAGGDDGAGGATGGELGPLRTALREQTIAALGATTWPDLDPPIDGIIPGGANLPCGDVVTVAPAERCTFGAPDAATTMVLVGDSTAAHQLDSFVALAERSDGELRVVSRAGFACSFVDLAWDTEDTEACADHLAETLRLIESLEPDLVVVQNTYEPMPLAGEGRDATVAEFADGLGRYLDRIEPHVGRVVHLSPPPPGASVRECYRPGGSPVDCLTRVGGPWRERAAAIGALAADRGQPWVDAREFTCVDDVCPAFIGDDVVKIDYVHYSGAFAVAMAPALGERLAVDGVLSGDPDSDGAADGDSQ